MVNKKIDWLELHNRTMAEIEWESELRHFGRDEPIQVKPTEEELQEIMKRQQKETNNE